MSAPCGTMDSSEEMGQQRGERSGPDTRRSVLMRRKRSDEDGCVVYFIQSGPGGPVKIGFTSKDPKDRLFDLQAANPVPLHLIGAVPGGQPLEEELHRIFDAGALGREWFRPDAPNLPQLLRHVFDQSALHWVRDDEEPPFYRGCRSCPWMMEPELTERGFDQCWTCLRDEALSE